MAWTDERVELLRKYWAEGHTASQIAELLGDGLTRNAVIGKAHRMKLAARPSPLKRGSTRKTAAKATKPATKATTEKAAAPAKAAAKTTAAKAPASKPATPAKADTEPAVKPAVEKAPAKAARPAQPAAPGMTAKEAAAAVSATPLTSAAEAISPSTPPTAPKAVRARKGRVTLLDLNDRICRWPIGHPDKANFHFCGKPVNPGFPYCNDHCLEAYQTPQPRKERPAPRFSNSLPRAR